jgi:hypothetical protein
MVKLWITSCDYKDKPAILDEIDCLAIIANIEAANTIKLPRNSSLRPIHLINKIRYSKFRFNFFKNF